MADADPTERAQGSQPSGRVDLSGLRKRVATLDRDHPLRVVVGTLPRELSVPEYMAILPTLWRIAEHC